MTTQFGNTDLYVKRSEIAALGDNSVTITDVSGGGSIGTAANTVDKYSIINVNQLTPSQVLTVPSLTSPTLNKVIQLNNVGTTAFTAFSTVLQPNTGITLTWTGSAYAVTGTSSGSTSVTVAGGKTVTFNNTVTFSGTDAAAVNVAAGGTVAYTGGNLGQFAATTSAQLASVLTNETGTGLVVFNTSPTLVTPTLGVATATSINGLTVTTSTGTITVANLKTVVFNNGITFAGTDSTTMTFPSTSATIARTDALQTFTGVQTFSSTPVFTHITVEGVTSTGATGTGSLVFATSPTLVTPVLGAATGTSLAVTGSVLSSGTTGIGYSTGAGGAVTQATNRTTPVTLSKISGAITTNTASLAAETGATFTVTNTLVAITDVVVLSMQSGSNGGNTTLQVTSTSNGSFNITVANQNASGGTAETGAIIINFVVLKGVSA